MPEPTDDYARIVHGIDRRTEEHLCGEVSGLGTDAAEPAMSITCPLCRLVLTPGETDLTEAEKPGASCPDCEHLIGVHSHDAGCMDSMIDGRLDRDRLGFCPCQTSSLALIENALRAAHVDRTPGRVRLDQTILASDPERQGNCVSACAATHLGLPLESVPHFIEADQGATTDGSEGSDGWWWLLVGFMAGHGLWPVVLDSIDDAESTELVWVAGPSPRGVFHQVLYRTGRLWHDPHPSKAGLSEVREVLVWRRRTHDHEPSNSPAGGEG